MQYKILNRNRHWFYFSSQIIGCLLLVWGVVIYRITLIDVKIPILIILVVGTIAFLIDKAKYNSTYEINQKNYFGWLQSIFSWGFIVCTLFMVSNKYLAKPEFLVNDFVINNTSSMRSYPRGKSYEKPLIRINYNGKIRELIFSNKYLKEMKEYRSVTLKTKKGFWGFNIVEDQKLNK